MRERRLPRPLPRRDFPKIAALGRQHRTGGSQYGRSLTGENGEFDCGPRAAVRTSDSLFTGTSNRDQAEHDCGQRHAVAIKPSLRRQSPKNGNIRGGGQRLSANWPRIRSTRDSGDGLPNRKSPPIVGLSAIRGASFSDAATGWLTWEGSNLHIPNPKRPFETFKESALISGRLGEFCSHELRILNMQLSLKSPDFLGQTPKIDVIW
jgi:hypothetical protein